MVKNPPPSLAELARRRSLRLHPAQAGLLSKIDAFGWTVIAVFAAEDEPASPPFAYTIGLSRLGGPELLITGLPGRVSAGILNNLGELVRAGHALGPGRRDGVLDNGVPLELRPFAAERYQEFLGQLIWFADTFAAGVRPAVLQVVWPDRDGRFPWDAGLEAKYRAEFARTQPLALARLN